jgi:histidine ammonia-lyase
VQTIPTNANNQDVVSMGCTAARLTRELAAKAWKILAIQALALAQAADLRGHEIMGGHYRQLHQLVRGVSARLLTDRPLFEDIASVTELLQSAAAQEQLLPPRPAGPE